MKRASALLAVLVLLAVAPGQAALPPEIEWGAAGAGAGQFAMPSDAAVSSTGDVYVADQDNHRIQRFNADGVYAGEWGGPGEGPGQFDRPVSLAIDAADNVYVSDHGNSRVQKFRSDGSFITAWGTPGSADGQFADTRMWGVAVAGDGSVYVADSGNSRIQRFDSDGRFLGKWGSAGGGPGEFARPRGIGIDQLGNVYVADRDNHRIQKFTASGRFLLQWGSRGRAPDQISAPYDVEVDDDGNVHIADFGNDRLDRYTQDGVFLDTTLRFGNDSRSRFLPRGIGADASGRVYVADQGSSGNRILRFGAAGLPAGIETADSIDQLSDPRPFREINVETQGTVIVTLPGGSAGASQAGAGGPVLLKDAAQLPVRSIVDTTHGKITLESAAAARGGRTQTGEFFNGSFQLIQRRSSRPVTEMVLKGGGFRSCPSTRRSAADTSQRRRRGRRSVVRRLWGNARGRFRTRGRYSSATVRGTRWVVEDRCDGTLTRVRRGSVTVTDLRARRTVRLRAGQRYLARPRR